MLENMSKHVGHDESLLILFFLFTQNKPDFSDFSLDPSEKTESELVSDAKGWVALPTTGVEISRLQQPLSLLLVQEGESL